MSLLILFGGATAGTVTITPIPFDALCSVLMPDEVPTGGDFSIYMEIVDETGPLALDSAPQVRVRGLLLDGTPYNALALSNMTRVGSSNVWKHDANLTNSGVYEVTVVGLVGAVAFAATRSLTVRPKFDPIGLAVDDVLVSRMDADPTLHDL